MDIQNPEELMQQDEMLKAVEAAQALPDDDPAKARILAHAGHLAGPEACQDYYRSAMRGAPCPEEHIFRRHEQVKRFAVIRRLIVERKHKTVLDLGCLDGWQLLNLAAAGVSGVGVDLNPEALAVARERAVKWGFPLMFIASAIETFDIRPYEPLTDRFDAVILSEVLEHVLDPVACLKTAARHLASGGIVYVSVPATPIPHHGKAEDAREHLRVYSEDDLVAAAKAAGLTVTVDRELIPEQDAETHESFVNRTISFRRAAITVYCNHVTNGWNPAKPEDLGGSEEMVVRTAEAWARRGHEVIVHQNGAEAVPALVGQLGAEWKGVRYVPRSFLPKPGQDLLVLFKTLDFVETKAGTTVFWTTDLPQPGGAAQFLPPRVADALDAVACISEWQRREIVAACPWLDPSKAKVHWLGVDPEEMAFAQAVEKVPGRVLYASSYDRGLGALLELWPMVRERVPNAELHVTYGWDFWKRSEAVVPAPVAESMRQERARLEKLLTQPGVVHLGRLPRAEFLRELGEASVWAYPCTGGELCCKTALEAQAAGCELVVVPTMALAETVQVGVHSTFENFQADLVARLQVTMGPSKYLSPNDLDLPSWDDLASWLWEQAADKAAGAQLILTAEASEPAVPEPAAALPERFTIPVCTGPVPTIDGLSILMAVKGMPFDGNTDREKSLGGSETCALQLSRELVKRGHSVTVFANLPEKSQPGKFDGVVYMPIQDFPRYAAATPHDLSIVQREPMGFNQPLQSKLNILWCHDLGLRRYHPMFRASLWNVDYVVPVSHWHGRQLAAAYDLSPEMIAPMRNGIDLEAIQRHSDRRGARDVNAVVFASRPERGLDLLLSAVFPRLLERNPKLVLYVAGYDNTVQEMQGFYAHCHQLMANLGPRAKWMGHLKKAELYGLYSRARVYLYPTRNFKEVSCLSVMEAAACGLPFVATTLGALPETMAMAPGASCLVEHPGREATEDFIARYVDAAWGVLHDDLRNKRMSEAGRTGSQAYSWVDVAREWEDFAYGAIELRSRDKLRLARHWWRLGDIRGVEMVQPLLDPGQVAAFSPGTAMPSEDDAPPRPSEHVLKAVAQAAADVKAQTVLGLGPHGHEAAETVARMIGGAATDQAPADFVFGVETLDCAADPAAHARDIEPMLSPGGHGCFVVAMPGVQQGRLHMGAPRRRRWVFDGHDVKDLLGKKTDLLAVVIGGGESSPYDGRMSAWSLYRFRKGGPVGEIDRDRRVWLQSPQLSLSACLIVKDGEALLGRCLKSIRPYCDEIVIDDNGSTDTTPDILRRFGVTAATGPSPIEAGFDAARNHNVARATGDLVLWIDADEELLDPHQLPKYLRWSMYNGFGVPQHHFSAVPPNAFKPDLPVRIFRRTGLDGKPTGIRFFGIVHEHPELAINHSVGQSIVLSDVHIAHDGYLTETGRRKRFDRNIPLMFRDRIKYPDRMLGKFLMIRDWVHLARYSIERNGRQLTSDAAQFLESAVTAYQKDFLGRTHMMAVDGLCYYNEALQLLGRGFEVQVSVKVGGMDGASHDFAYAGRVADAADLEAMTQGATKELAGIWDGEYI